jgi:hypothetical protein
MKRNAVGIRNEVGIRIEEEAQVYLDGVSSTVNGNGCAEVILIILKQVPIAGSKCL